MNFLLILLLILPAVLINANISRDYYTSSDENILELNKRGECCPCPSNVQPTLFSSGSSKSQLQGKNVHWDDKKAIKRPIYIHQENNYPNDARLEEMIKVIRRFG